MKIPISTESATKTIGADLHLLRALLKDAASCSAEAHARIQQGDRDGAIGVVAGLDAILTDALALYRAALAIHCATRSKVD